jgi:hypothetical protein
MTLSPSLQPHLRGHWPTSALGHWRDPLELRQLKAVAFTVLLLPLNWLLGTTLPFVYGVTAYLLMAPQRLSALEVALASLAGALLLGLGVALPDGVEASRVVAALFNLSIVLVVVVFANFGRKIQLRGDPAGHRTDGIYRAALVCFGVQAAVVLGTKAYVTLTGQQELGFRTLVLGAFGELPGVLSFYSHVALSSVDWTGDNPSLRIIGLGIYATEGALLLLVVGLFGAIYLANRRRWLGVALVELAIFAMLVLTASRTTALAYIVSLPLLLTLAGRRVVGATLLLAPVLLAGCIVFGTHAADLMAALFTRISEARPGSSAGRFANYTLAIDLVREHNVLTGLGVKPRDDAISEIPIGSHSTWISMFTKGGLIALAALSAVYLALLGKVAASQFTLLLGPTGSNPARAAELVYLSRCVLVVLVWWLTEDFDAAAYQAVMAGLSFGLFWGLWERGPANG